MLTNAYKALAKQASSHIVRGQPWYRLGNLVGFASASVPMDPQSPRYLVPYPSSSDLHHSAM